MTAEELQSLMSMKIVEAHYNLMREGKAREDEWPKYVYLGCTEQAAWREMVNRLSLREAMRGLVQLDGGQKITRFMNVEVLFVHNKNTHLATGS